MKNMVLLAVTLAVAVLAPASLAVADVPQMINYQGRLTDENGDPLTGVYQLVFTIYDAEADGNIKWQETHPAVTVTNGLFNVFFGAGTPPVPVEDTVFNQPDRWLGITVGADPELTPRTRLVTVPYAFRVSTVDGSSGGTISGDVSIQSDLDVDGDLRVTGKATIGPGHTNTGNYAFVAGTNNSVTENYSSVSGGNGNIASNYYSTVGGGCDNLASGDKSTIGGGCKDTADATYSTVGGGWANAAHGHSSVVAGGIYNSANGYRSTVGGGYDNVASGDSSSVGGGANNEATGSANTVGGGTGNIAWSGLSTVGGGGGNRAEMWGATIGGGESNTASGQSSTIGGGYDNTASGYGSIVGGGWENIASAQYSTVGGGYRDTASGDYSSVGGGADNDATGNHSTVCGGWSNRASAQFSTVCGGTGNSNAGLYSVITGGKGNVLTENADTSMAFGHDVYVDSPSRVVFFDGVHDGRFGLNRDDNDGGVAHPVHVGTNATNGNGAHLTAGGVWTNGSSREFKENFETLNGKEVLDRIDELNIESWEYKGTSERHIWPCAEDFHEAFDIGVLKEDGTRDNKYLAAGDVAGVALIGVKELYLITQKLEKKTQEIQQLKAEMAQMQALMETLLAQQRGSKGSSDELALDK